MKFSVDQQILNTCLRHIQNAIPNKPQLPILSSIHFSLKENVLTMAATDLYLGIKSSVQVNTDQELEKVVPGNTFKDLISSFGEGKVDFEVEDNQMQIKFKGSNLKTPIQSAEEFPEFPEVEGEEIILKKETLEKIKKLVVFGASNDEARPVLTTVAFNFKESGLEVAATDGFRLAVLQFPEIVLEEEKILLIPVKAFNEVSKILSGSDAEKVTLQVSSEMKQVKFSVDQTEIYVRMLEGEYPPYQKIIPSDFSMSVEMDGEELKKELQRAFILAKNASNIVEWVIEPEKLVITSSAPSVGKYQGEVVLTNKEQKSDKIAFNITYVLDFLASVKPESVWFGMNESLKPAMFRIDQEEKFIYVVMPFRVNG